MGDKEELKEMAKVFREAADVIDANSSEYR